MEEETLLKWGREVTTNGNLMRLIRLRKEYEPIYSSSQGFKRIGWERISKELRINKNANSCRKRFLDLSFKYRVCMEHSFYNVSLLIDLFVGHKRETRFRL